MFMYDKNWINQKAIFQETSGINSSNFESLLAYNNVQDAYSSGKIFPEILFDGDNDTIEQRNTSEIYGRDY